MRYSEAHLLGSGILLEKTFLDRSEVTVIRGWGEWREPLVLLTSVLFAEDSN